MKSVILITSLIALVAASPTKPTHGPHTPSLSVKPTATATLEPKVCDKRCALEKPKCEKPWYPYKFGESLCWACCVDEAVGVIE
ncbi:hypothetical protein BCR34DRAFT_598057 [Clohesyomyces aquaticus]|uniref:Uncharacterized protein n=1 Tax=Clohesyomyces aquaticus TaxID=1231657 RepID=A0A1Y2A1Z1_9PLEO|nr:hypothetical protein BCR34DRAFT_598057 [Clohesyomyces aquaticus]